MEKSDTGPGLSQVLREEIKENAIPIVLALLTIAGIVLMALGFS